MESGGCRSSDTSYLILVLILVILIVVLVVIILVIFVLEVILVEVVHALLELQSLASDPVNGTWDELFLDVLTELVVELKLGLNVVVNLLVVILRWRRRVEKVEEGWGWDRLLDNAGLLGVCVTFVSLAGIIMCRGIGLRVLLLRCFLLSTLTVRS